MSLGVHVLAVDYRSYGDSSRVALTEASVVEDGRAALAWVEARVGPQVQVILWGHSLGTAIATRYVGFMSIHHLHHLHHLQVPGDVQQQPSVGPGAGVPLQHHGGGGEKGIINKVQ